MNVRCKFCLVEIKNHEHYTAQTFIFEPRYDETVPEDQRFYKYTPTGRFEMYVDNPRVQAEWKVGKYYYFDCQEVPSE